MASTSFHRKPQKDLGRLIFSDFYFLTSNSSLSVPLSKIKNKYIIVQKENTKMENTFC